MPIATALVKPPELFTPAIILKRDHIGWWYLFLCRSASFWRRIFLAQAGQYFARLDFGVKLSPHSQHSFR